MRMRLIVPLSPGESGRVENFLALTKKTQPEATSCDVLRWFMKCRCNGQQSETNHDKGASRPFVRFQDEGFCFPEN